MNRLFVAISTILCLLVLTYPCHSQEGGVIYACVNKSDGTMRIVQTPTCKKIENLLSWNVQGPPGEIDQPIDVTVNCPGQSLNSVLGSLGVRVARTTVNIAGFCDEQVNLFQHNVTFRPVPGSTNAGMRKLFLFGAHGIVIENLRLRNLEATNNAAFDANNLRVDQPEWTAVAVHDSSSGNLVNPTFNCQGGFCIEVGSGGYLHLIEGKLTGQAAGSAVVATNGGSTDITKTVIQGFGWAVEVGDGGSAYLDGVIITGAAGYAIDARGAVTVFQTEIRDNAYGIYVEPGGTANIYQSQILNSSGTGVGTDGGVVKIDGTTVSGNGGVGVGIGYGGAGFINGGTISNNGSGAFAIGGTLVVSDSTISDNRGRGIEARNISTVKLGTSNVESNQGDGILLDDVSFLEVSGGTTNVRNNSGWGLYC